MVAVAIMAVALLAGGCAKINKPQTLRSQFIYAVGLWNVAAGAATLFNEEVAARLEASADSGIPDQWAERAVPATLKITEVITETTPFVEKASASVLASHQTATDDAVKTAIHYIKTQAAALSALMPEERTAGFEEVR